MIVAGGWTGVGFSN